MASDGDLARSEFIASSLSETSNGPSSLLGDGGWISTTVGQDIPPSGPESLLSVGVDSEPYELSGWYSLTVDNDEMREWDREWHELVEDMVVYDDMLLRLSEDLCFGDLGLVEPAELSAGVDSGMKGLGTCGFFMFMFRPSEYPSPVHGVLLRTGNRWSLVLACV